MKRYILLFYLMSLNPSFVYGQDNSTIISALEAQKSLVSVKAFNQLEDENGQRFVYDVNTNTNYNSKAEKEAGGERQGMFEIAKYLGHELRLLQEKELLTAVF